GSFAKHSYFLFISKYGPGQYTQALAQGTTDHQLGWVQFFEHPITSFSILSHNPDTMRIIPNKHDLFQRKFFQGIEMRKLIARKINGVKKEHWHWTTTMDFFLEPIGKVFKAFRFDDPVQMERSMGIGSRKQPVTSLQQGLDDQLGGQVTRRHGKTAFTAYPFGQICLSLFIDLERYIGFAGCTVMHSKLFHIFKEQLQKRGMGLQTKISGAPKIQVRSSIDEDLSIRYAVYGMCH